MTTLRQTLTRTAAGAAMLAGAGIVTVDVDNHYGLTISGPSMAEARGGASAQGGQASPVDGTRGGSTSDCCGDPAPSSEPTPSPAPSPEPAEPAEPTPEPSSETSSNDGGSEPYTCGVRLEGTGSGWARFGGGDGFANPGDIVIRIPGRNDIAALVPNEFELWAPSTAYAMINCTPVRFCATVKRETMRAHGVQASCEPVRTGSTAHITSPQQTGREVRTGSSATATVARPVVPPSDAYVLTVSAPETCEGVADFHQGLIAGTPPNLRVHREPHAAKGYSQLDGAALEAIDRCDAVGVALRRNGAVGVFTPDDLDSAITFTRTGIAPDFQAVTAAPITVDPTGREVVTEMPQPPQADTTEQLDCNLYPAKVNVTYSWGEHPEYPFLADRVVTLEAGDISALACTDSAGKTTISFAAVAGLRTVADVTAALTAGNFISQEPKKLDQDAPSCPGVTVTTAAAACPVPAVR